VYELLTYAIMLDLLIDVHIQFMTKLRNYYVRN